MTKQQANCLPFITKTSKKVDKVVLLPIYSREVNKDWALKYLRTGNK
jgi:hypothetical protein